MSLTQEDLQQIKELLSPLATKEDLIKQSLELKSYTDQQTETLARIIAETVAEPMEKHFAEVKSEIEMKKRVELLETKFIKLQEALHLNF